MGISPERLARALKASQIPASRSDSPALVARATIEKPRRSGQGVRVMELVRKSSPAGELFDGSAVAVKKLEHLSMTLGAMVDAIRGLTVRPLTASDRAACGRAF